MTAPGNNRVSAVVNLGVQDSVGALFLDRVTAAGGAGDPKTYSVGSAGYAISDGINGVLYWNLWENNVAGSGAIIIEGCDDLAPAGGISPFWVPVGYYAIVANGVTATTLTRAQGAVTLTQNTFTKLQMLDAYAYMRARITSNASAASLSARMYGVAA